MRVERYAQLIGASPALVELKRELDRLASVESKVLITGESGVGKELIAREIHRRGSRAGRPFVPVNCAGLPETLLESELFGHVKGSFTGAYRDRPGKLELADRGTVFLDEVGEMSLRMQGLLLRFVETGELQKVGLDRPARSVDARVITATNRKLSDLIRQGQFREDLFYRLHVVHVEVPPLRERREDIPLLIDHCVKALHQRQGYRLLTFESDAMAAMLEYRWPGNVRELENVVEQLAVTARSDQVRLEDLPSVLRTRGENGLPARERRRTVARDLYQNLIGGRQSFWTTVYPMYMRREITRANLRDLVGMALEDARGNYRIFAELFNLGPRDYKRLLSFLRKHECHLPFRDYRGLLSDRSDDRTRTRRSACRSDS